MGPGKWERVVGVEDSRTTQEPVVVPQSLEHSVLMRGEETHEDDPTHSIERIHQTGLVSMQSRNEQFNIVDLYSMDDGEVYQNCSPFLQHISFAGPQGEIVRVKALFDEGAMVSAMCTSVFEQAKHRLGNWVPSMKQLRMANGTVIPSKAVWRGEVTINGISAQGEFEVFDSGGGWKFLFGKPLLHAFKAIHEYETDTVSITGKGGSTTIRNQSHARQPHIEESSENMSHKLAETGIMQNTAVGGKNPPPREVLPHHNMPTVAHTDQAWLPEPKTPGITPLNFLQDDAAIFTRATDPKNPKRVMYIVKAVQYGETLTPEERGKVEDLVSRYADIFACSLSEVTQVPGIQHRLNIPEGTKFNLRVHQRALTPPQTQFLHSRIDEMLAAGIIEKAPPELVKCCATTVLAQKAHEQGGLTLEELQYKVNEQCTQHGQPPAFTLPEREAPSEAPPPAPIAGPQKWRICQNFNAVNRHTVIAPMPQGDIRAKQLRLSGHKYVSVFDFAAGFYAVEIAEESRPYTAFYIEGRGYFWYKRMAMGLTGAPSTFADMTATQLHDLLARAIMELFVDDGGCSADSFEEMLEKLERIFQRCRERKLSLSPTKCRLFMTETTFAGATVGPTGVQPDLEKLTAIVNWKEPADALNLESFLGLTSHFRDLIQGYAKREGPLRNLVKAAPLTHPYVKTTYRRILRDFKLVDRWTEEHTKAFIDLKAALVSRPILQAPKYDGSPFVVTSDGCQEGLAAVLSQRVRSQKPSGKWVERLLPIAFASKRTSTAEQKYKPFLLEFAALKFGLDKFSDTIWGFPVEIETDCQALRDVVLSDNLNAAHARWRDGILAHNIIDVRHVPGKLNVIADGLSRQWEGQPRNNGLQDDSEWTVSEDWESNTGLINDMLLISPVDERIANELCKRFANESVFLEVVESILQIDSAKLLRDRKRARHRASQFLIEDGRLWRLRGGTSVRARSKVECVSREEAKQLAIKQHEENGHWGRDATKIALTDRIYSPKLDATIMEAIADCAKCKNFGSPHLHSLLEPITRRHPFELLVGDYLTLPKARGYHTLGVYLDTFSQHVWAFKYKTAGTARSTIDSLSHIFRNFTPSETFMSDGGKHFNNAEVRNFCAKWSCKTHVIAAYSPWVNGLVEGTNKILLHVLKRLCAPNLGEDDYEAISWDTLPNSWPDHLDEAIAALNYRILPALKFSPKELLLGQVINTPRTDLANSTSAIRLSDVNIHMAYVAQQRLDGYEATVQHAIKRKAAFDKRVLARSPREVIFSPGQLVQFYHSSMHNTFEAKRKLLPKWSSPHRITERLRNSYRLETLPGEPIAGEFHARRLRAFIPREGTKLAEEQNTREMMNTRTQEDEDEEETEDEEDEDEEETEDEEDEEKETQQEDEEDEEVTAQG